MLRPASARSSATHLGLADRRRPGPGRRPGGSRRAPRPAPVEARSAWPMVASMAFSSAVDGPMWRSTNGAAARRGEGGRGAHAEAPDVGRHHQRRRRDVTRTSPSVTRRGRARFQSCLPHVVLAPERFRGELLLRRPAAPSGDGTHEDSPTRDRRLGQRYPLRRSAGLAHLAPRRQLVARDRCGLGGAGLVGALAGQLGQRRPRPRARPGRPRCRTRPGRPAPGR